MTDPAPEQPPVPTEPDDNRDAVVRKAYAMATKTLRDQHLKEFQQLQKDYALEMGVEWTPRLTKEEKAAEDLATILRDHPTLRQQLTDEIKAQEQG